MFPIIVTSLDSKENRHGVQRQVPRCRRKRNGNVLNHLVSVTKLRVIDPLVSVTKLQVFNDLESVTKLHVFNHLASVAKPQVFYYLVSDAKIFDIIYQFSPLLECDPTVCLPSKS